MFTSTYLQCRLTPSGVPALWQQVSSCSSSAQIDQQSGFEKQQSWLLPLVVVLGVLVVAIVVVLFCKKRKDRFRSYSSELGLSELAATSPTTPQKGFEEQVLTPTQPEQPTTGSDETTTGYDPVSTAPLAPTDTSEPALPPNWMKQTDPTSGQSYFYNTQTGVSQWETPDA